MISVCSASLGEIKLSQTTLPFINLNSVSIILFSPLKQPMFKTVCFVGLISLAACNSGTTVQNQKENVMDSTKDKEWIKHTNIYEVNVRQYTSEGTFKAFAKELQRLKEMGVHTLWFMPITPISKKYERRIRKLLCMF